jgi:hypothetical protein
MDLAKRRFGRGTGVFLQLDRRRPTHEVPLPLLVSHDHAGIACRHR